MGELEVVHGKGTGRLRAVLAQRLGEDPRVRESGLGGDGRFDDGVTLVRL
jgi:dsDNA-specific endonuclease/ATPase MutS2